MWFLLIWTEGHVAKSNHFFLENNHYLVELFHIHVTYLLKKYLKWTWTHLLQKYTDILIFNFASPVVHNSTLIHKTPSLNNFVDLLPFFPDMVICYGGRISRKTTNPLQKQNKKYKKTNKNKNWNITNYTGIAVKYSLIKRQMWQGVKLLDHQNNQGKYNFLEYAFFNPYTAE